MSSERERLLTRLKNHAHCPTCGKRCRVLLAEAAEFIELLTASTDWREAATHEK